MGEGQADERAAGERVGVRRALAGEVGQEQEPVAARAGPRRRGATRSSYDAPGASASRNQRRLPAADSITDIMCQRPGTAWQKAWTRPRASKSGRSVVAKTTPDVPSDRATTPGSTAPTPTALAAWSPPPATTGVPARSPVAAAAPAVTTPVTSGPSCVGGIQAGSIPSAASDLGRPVAGGQVEEHRPRAVGLVHRVVAGEAEPDVVLRQQDVGDPRPDVRLVVADPDELGGGEAGERVVAGDRDEPLRADDLADQVALGAGPLVVPEDRRPEDLVGGVEEDGAVHLAGEADGDDVVAGDARVGEDGPDRGDRAVPPQARVLLAPERPRDARSS